MHLNGMPLCYSKQTLTAWQTTFVHMRTELLGVYMLNMDRLLHNNVLIYCNGLSWDCNVFLLSAKLHSPAAAE